MTRARSANVTMSARVVESFRGEWSPLDDTFADPEIALDFVRDIRPTHGPTIVRVAMSGGTTRQRERLVGDWLCEGPGPRSVLPTAYWWHDGVAEAWASGMELVDAWETCDRAQWLIHAYGAAPLRAPRLMALAVCDCVRAAADVVAPSDVTVGELLAVVESWARSEGDLTQVGYAADEAHEQWMPDEDVVTGTNELFAAIRQIGYAEIYSVEAGERDPSQRAVASAQYAAEAIGSARSALLIEGRSDVDLEAIVRRRISTLSFLRANLPATPRQLQKGKR